MKYQEKKDALRAVLAPPKGYRLERLFLTTYTLNQRFLAELFLLCGTQSKAGVADLTALGLRVELERAYEDWKDRVVVLANIPQAGMTDRTRAGLDIYTKKILDTCVYVQSVEGGVFHPKLVLAMFCSEEDAQKKDYRLMVSSKNLTYDTYFQDGVILSARETEEGACNGKQLWQFLERFPELGENKAALNGWEGIRKLTFCLQDTPAELCFTVPGGGNLKTRLQEDLERLKKQEAQETEKAEGSSCLVIVTDSLGPDRFFQALGGAPAGYRIISNRKSWINLLGEWNEETGTVTVPQGVLPNKHDWIALGSPYIHAKEYIFRIGDQKITYVGSANCSRQALENNYECMVRMEETVEELPDFSRMQILEGGASKESYSLKQVEKSDLDTAQDGNELEVERYAKAFRFRLSWSREENRLSVTYQKPAPQYGKPKIINHIILGLPNQTGRVQMDLENGGEAVFRCRYEQLPERNTPQVILRVDVQGRNSEQIVPVDACWDPVPEEQENVDYTAALYRGFLPRVRDAIPPVAESGYYYADDTDEQRLAKFLAKADDVEAAVAEVQKRIDDLVAKTAAWVSEEDIEDIDEDVDSTVLEDPEIWKNELVAAKKNLNAFQALLEGWK